MNNSAPAAIYDHAGSLARMGDDLELFREMASYLASDGRQWLRDIQEALADDNIEIIQDRAHSLKGLVSNFGESRASRAAAKLEELARAKHVDELASNVAILETAHKELLNALAPYLSARDGA